MKIDAKINIDVRNGERRSIELQQNSAIEGKEKNTEREWDKISYSH